MKVMSSEVEAWQVRGGMQKVEGAALYHQVEALPYPCNNVETIQVLSTRSPHQSAGSVCSDIRYEVTPGYDRLYFELLSGVVAAIVHKSAIEVE